LSLLCHGWMTGPPSPIDFLKKFSLSPSPQNPKKKKNWPHWLHTEPSSVPTWNFYYGPIPLHNRMDTYSTINRAEWAIAWNSGVFNLRKGCALPPSLPWMDDGMDDGTDWWKGQPRQPTTTTTWQNLKYYISRLLVSHNYFFCLVKGLNFVSSICIGLFFIIDRTGMGWNGGHEFFALLTTPNTYLGDVQKDN
jgi:hypothetical protein